MDRGSEGQDTARLRAGQPGPAGGGARAGDVPPAPTNGAAAATNGPDANGAGEAAAVQTPVQTPAPKIAIPKIAATGVLIPTHNDGANIATLLERLLEEPGVGEVVVVASGCDDDTVPIISEVAAGDPRVQLYVEPERSGKASAVNFGIACMSLPFIVVVSGDVLPEPGAIGLVVEALGRPGVGLAGGRPMPVNPEETAVGYACHLLWRLHHRLALHQPKLGEMIALRAEAVVSLPRTSVDEACFQALLESQGWTAVYVPEAIVANRGPGTVADFVKQRRQIHTGHLWLRRGQHYSVPSLHLGLLVTELWRDLVAERHRLRPRPLAFTAGAVALEAGARLLARFDYLRGRENVVWAMVTSTKGPTGGPNGLGPGHR
ncbi:MAG: poly-beta,6-N-acetyl-D-glucosamine synthase [Actinomycetota bacterium]|nr:poly-beta,6-N-acetyl-D-glucosamine synthase [Actinomycetota bacterium]